MGNEPLKFYGKWSLNEDEHPQIDGELVIDPTEEFVWLFLKGNIAKKNQNGFDLYYSIAYGETYQGKLITLLNLEVYHSNAEATRLKVKYAFISDREHFCPFRSQITKSSFSSSFFPSFLAGTYNRFNVEGRASSIQRFSFEKSKTISLYKEDHFEIAFEFATKFHFSNESELEFAFYNYIFLSTEYKGTTNFEECESGLFFLKDFFSLFCTNFIRFNSIQIFIKSDTEDTPFDVYTSPKHQSFNKKHSLSESPLTYKNFKDSFGRVFAKWMTLKSFWKEGLALYLQIKNNGVKTPVQSFLNIVFAIETLHNNFYDLSTLSEEEKKEFAKQKKEALKSFTEPFKNKVSQALSYVGSLSFKERLLDLINKGEGFCSRYIYNSEEFSKRVVKQRNYLAHNHNQPDEIKYIQENEYRYFIYSLKLLYEFHLYTLLEVDVKDIAIIIKKNPTFWHLEKHVEQHYRKVNEG